MADPPMTAILEIIISLWALTKIVN